MEGRLKEGEREKDGWREIYVLRDREIKKRERERDRPRVSSEREG